MTNITPPPIQNPIMDEDGKPTIPWTLFFNSTFEGDKGEAWLPVFQNLTTVGMPTITGKYYRISKSLVFFTITIVPDTSTSSTAGTTYAENFPLDFTGNGVCFAVAGGFAEIPGMIDGASDRIFVPDWTGVTIPITIIGFCEAS